jgi:hypothetical protein
VFYFWRRGKYKVEVGRNIILNIWDYAKEEKNKELKHDWKTG